MVRNFAGLLALIICAISQPAMADDTCVMADNDRQWLANALKEWQYSAQVELGLPDAELPVVHVFDASCSFEIESGDVANGKSTSHGGSPVLADGSTLPVAPVSFAFGRERFVMSLPSVWRQAGVESELGLETLMTGVLLHEIMHTLQSDLATRLLDPIGTNNRLGDQLSDDLLQERFEGFPGYVADYEQETNALYQAATVDSNAVARGLAAHALHLMRERRAKWFTGRNAYFTELDDIFLTMEGAGQWMMYRYFLKLDDAEGASKRALDATRRGGRWWSQDQGLALILVVDRLNPNWRESVFSDPEWRAENLLAAALAQ